MLLEVNSIRQDRNSVSAKAIARWKNIGVLTFDVAKNSATRNTRKIIVSCFYDSFVVESRHQVPEEQVVFGEVYIHKFYLPGLKV